MTRRRIDIVAQNVAYYREANGLSQRRLAEQLGIERELISKYERGIREPNEDRLRQMADIFELNTFTLFYLEPLYVDEASA